MRMIVYCVFFAMLIATFILLNTKKNRCFFSQTWFGFLLILGGVFFLLDARIHDHLILSRGRFAGGVLNRWQMCVLGLISIGFGVVWIYGPLRRWLKKDRTDDDVI